MTKLTKQEKLDRKQYFKTNKKYKKQIKQLSKNYGPWEYGFLEIFFEIMLNHWIDFYSLGYGVVCEESENEPTRLEIATKMKKLLNDYQDFHYTVKDGVMDVTDPDEYLKAKEEKRRDLYNYVFDHIHVMWD